MTTATKMMLKDRNVLEDLAREGFMASEDQIEALARYNLQSITGSELVRGVYLKAVIVGVQKEIEGSQVESEPLVVLGRVHDRFYGAVMRAVTTKNLKDDNLLPKDDRKARALERNRRGNFARSAKSTVAAFIKTGGDIMQLRAENITKSELTAFALAMKTRANQPSVEHRVQTTAERLEQLLREFADQDKPGAVNAVEHSLERLTALLQELCPHRITTSSVEAVRDHKMLRLPSGSFWPVVQPASAHA